jgi:hypothetical protein
VNIRNIVGNSQWSEKGKKSTSVYPPHVICILDKFPGALCNLLLPSNATFSNAPAIKRLYKKFQEIQLFAIHSYDDSRDVFNGIQKFYGSFFFKNEDRYKGFETLLVGIDGLIEKCDISQMPFIFNKCNKEIYSNIIVNKNYNQLEVILRPGTYNLTEEKRGLNVTINKTKWPLIYSVAYRSSGGKLKLRYAKCNKDNVTGIKQFGRPKLVIGDSDSAFVDKTGEYGVLEFTPIIFAPNDDVKKLYLYKAAFESDKFAKLIYRRPGAAIAQPIIRHLREDFWKYFVDETGKPK